MFTSLFESSEENKFTIYCGVDCDLDSKSFSSINFVHTKNLELLDVKKMGDNFILSDFQNISFKIKQIEEREEILISSVKFQRFEKRRKKASHFSSLGEELLNNSENFQKAMEYLALIQNFKSNDFKEILGLILKNIVEFKNKFELKYYSLENVSELATEEDIVIFFDEEVALVKCINCSDELVQNFSLIISFVKELIDNGYLFFDESENEYQYFDFLKLNEVLSKLNFPVALFQNDVLLLSNELFRKLNVLPSAIIGKNSDDSIEIDENLFQMKKQNIPSIGDLCLFSKVEKRKDYKLDNKSDLGIITGSIAHELNNPVAGILAAVSILEMDDWDSESANLLQDLKDSATRCKGLVETFLGFSKHQNTSKTARAVSVDIEQAIALLRNRIVESGHNVNIKVCDSIAHKESNSLTLTIIFYLIFSELMTIYAHLKLIDKNLSKTLCIKILYENNEIILENESFEISKTEEKKVVNKLLSHLMEIENISFKISGKKIKLALLNRAV